MVRKFYYVLFLIIISIVSMTGCNSVSKVNCSTKEEKDMVDSLNEVSEEMKLHIDKLNEAIGKFKI